LGRKPPGTRLEQRDKSGDLGVFLFHVRTVTLNRRHQYSGK
jgi:hypothetical protein